MPSKGTPRFSIRLTPDDFARAERIKATTGLNDVANVIRYALAQVDPDRFRPQKKNPEKSDEVS